MPVRQLIWLPFFRGKESLITNNAPYLPLMYNTRNTPATPLNNAHLGGFFLFIKGFCIKFNKFPTTFQGHPNRMIDN
jgi:hypothetical protein